MQATLGKRAVGIKVTDLHGERIDFGRALGRMFGHILSFITFSVGFAMAVFTDRRQTLHDKLAGTLVVKREESPEEVEAAGIAPPAPMWQSISAVLGLILFGPFGVGILAAIAIPAYQNYTIRAQVAEGLNIAQPYKTAIATAIAAGTPLNRIDSSRLDVSFPDSAKYVDSVRVVQGAIDIHYGRSANKKINGGHLVLMPGVKGNEVQWFCGHASAPPDVTVPVQGYEKYTNVPDNVLPRVCTPGGAGLGQHHQQVLRVHLLPRPGNHLGDFAVRLRADGRLHLHGLERHQHLAARNLAAHGGRDRRNRAGHRGAHMLGISRLDLPLRRTLAPPACGPAHAPTAAHRSARKTRSACRPRAARWSPHSAR